MINPRRESWKAEHLLSRLPPPSPVHLPIFTDVYEIRFLKRSDSAKILTLQEIVAKHLPRPEIYRIDPREYIDRHFAGSQNVVGIFVGKELVAYHVVSFPGLNTDHFGWEIRFSRNQLLKSAHFETTAVHPEYRSKHLAKRMADIHSKILRYSGYEHILCTVSPFNYQSLCNVFRQGFLIRGIKETYYGLRFIMHKKLKLSAIRKPRQAVWLGQDETEQQQKLVEQGYLGFAVRSTDAGLEIAYGITEQK